MFAKSFLKGERSLAVIGLGYVGLPLAVAFSKKGKVIGFDINQEKVDLLRNGVDYTNDVPPEDFRQSTMTFTSDVEKLETVSVYIVAVPTPISNTKEPNLRPLIGACETVGPFLSPGDLIVFESTVYPGVTEDICIPILESMSGLKAGVDFTYGYSPERINPGDRLHTLATIVKVVAGCDDYTTAELSELYSLIVEAGTFEAASVKVAEAAKVIENTQRDINIALINELSLIFDKLDISTSDVLDAANSKWNFLNFEPGLVGGHCIGVDPYYIAHAAKTVGVDPQVILSGRRVNDTMGRHVAQTSIKLLSRYSSASERWKVGIYGLTFKEDVADVRNTRVVDIIDELVDYGIDCVVYDPVANVDDLSLPKEIEIADQFSELLDCHSIIFAVKHKTLLADVSHLFEMVEQGEHKALSCILDIKGVLDKSRVESNGLKYWSL